MPDRVASSSGTGHDAAPDAAPALSDRELTELQETGSVVLGHSLIDGLRLGEILAVLDTLGIEYGDVVLYGTGADHIAVTVKRDA